MRRVRLQRRIVVARQRKGGEVRAGGESAAGVADGKQSGEEPIVLACPVRVARAGDGRLVVRELSGADGDARRW
jgi:hypothetical protein